MEHENSWNKSLVIYQTKPAWTYAASRKTSQLFRLNIRVLQKLPGDSDKEHVHSFCLKFAGPTIPIMRCPLMSSLE